MDTGACLCTCWQVVVGWYSLVPMHFIHKDFQYFALHTLFKRANKKKSFTDYRVSVSIGVHWISAELLKIFKYKINNSKPR